MRAAFIVLLVLGTPAFAQEAAPAPAPEAEVDWGDLSAWTRPPELTAASPGLPPEIGLALGAERAALDARTTALDTQEARIRLAAEALDEQIARLESLKLELETVLGGAETAHGEDVERLVRIYRAMKPAQAGLIMNEMDLEVATLVIAAMPEKDAGPILANMRPVRAQAISKIIFERSRLPGDQRLMSVKID